MATQMEADATAVVRFLVEKQEQLRTQFAEIGDEPPSEATGPEIAQGTGLPPGRVNDAVALIESNGYAEVFRHMGTAPFDFGQVELNALGRFALQQAEAEADEATSESTPASRSISRAPHPIGSPYGFKEEDWEFVEEERLRTDRLKVVFGHKWESSLFNAKELRVNLAASLQNALDARNLEPGAEPATLSFVSLSAGYGEHLFNEIARDILSADIAIFETSDNNPNVMIEMGVALTWGVRVLPIIAGDASTPPSDISGQTWARYTNDGLAWEEGHDDRLLAMIRRALRRKTASGHTNK